MSLRSAPPFKTFLWLTALLVLAWLFFEQPFRVPVNENATPRAITVRGDLGGKELNAIELFQHASPSVVNITSVALRRNFFTLNVYEIPKGTGSGFVWDEKGRIVTNFHVIEDASRVHVTLADNTTWKAVLVGASPDRDLAVLQISAPASSLRPIPLGESEKLLVGQDVFAIGNPFGLDHTLTSGIVSALGREITALTGETITDMIQTDAAINPGNSGGPLLDSAGRLIGVNTAIYSPTGGSSGIGFAVPVDQVNMVVPELIKHGRLLKPSLGITVANDQLAQRLGIEGVLLIRIQPGSTAEKAGLRGTKQEDGELVLGDIIIGINGTAIRSSSDLSKVMRGLQIGEQVTLKIIRDNEQFQVNLILEPMG